MTRYEIGQRVVITNYTRLMSGERVPVGTSNGVVWGHNSHNATVEIAVLDENGAIETMRTYATDIADIDTTPPTEATD